MSATAGSSLKHECRRPTTGVLGAETRRIRADHPMSAVTHTGRALPAARVARECLQPDATRHYRLFTAIHRSDIGAFPATTGGPILQQISTRLQGWHPAGR